MATIQRFANPLFANGGYSIGGEKFARLKPIPGRLVGVRPKLETTTEADLVSRGITLMSDLVTGPVSGEHRQSIFGPQELQDCSRRFLGYRKANAMSREDIRFFILNYLAPCAFYFDQANEGYNSKDNPDETDFLILDGMVQQEYMYEALRDKMAAMNPKGAFVKGYDNKCPMANQVFQPGGDPMQYLATLQSQGNARSGLDFYNRAVSNYGPANYQWYPAGGINEPMGRRLAYTFGYGMSRLALASGPSLLPIGILWANMETPSFEPNSQAWNPGWAYRRELSTGVLYQNDENMMDQNHITEATLISLALGGGMVSWERPDWFSENLADAQVRQFYGAQPDDSFQGKNGAGSPTKRDGHRELLRRHLSPYNGLYIAGQWGGELNARAGWGFQYAAIRTTRNGQTSAWIEPHSTNLATILQAGKALNPIVLIRETGNDVGLISCGVGGDLIEARTPSGKVIAFDQRGVEPVVIAGTLTQQSITLLRSDAVQLQ